MVSSGLPLPYWVIAAVLMLCQVDERIRKMLAARDAELSAVRAALRAKEAKLRAAEESLALINQEVAGLRRR
jgi:Skp family chaperone for outer membrane proteins